MSTCSCHSEETGATTQEDPRYRRVLWIALVLNAAMFLVEIAGSVLSGSISLQADALDFLGDAANYAVGLIVLGMAAQWRARAALGKGLVMGAFGAWVAANTVWHAAFGTVPQAELMSGIGLLALAVNVAVTVLLFRYRRGDSNQLSVWLCTRNDAIANVAVIFAGIGVWLTNTHWPDIAVASVIAVLGLSGSYQVIDKARSELRPRGLGRRTHHAPAKPSRI
jgi:Co/Zn/Cd efflux system component